MSRLERRCKVGSPAGGSAIGRRLIALSAVAWLVVGCGASSDPFAPPAIVYGEDVCDACGMIISDERFAAATIVAGPDGEPEPRRFDDVGEMFEYHADHPELAVERWYVHDHASLAWIPADRATFVRAKSLSTPMGFGVAAFADRAAAEAFAGDVGGTVATFEDLRGP